MRPNQTPMIPDYLEIDSDHVELRNRYDDLVQLRGKISHILCSGQLDDAAATSALNDGYAWLASTALITHPMEIEEHQSLSEALLGLIHRCDRALMYVTRALDFNASVCQQIQNQKHRESFYQKVLKQNNSQACLPATRKKRSLSSSDTVYLNRSCFSYEKPSPDDSSRRPRLRSFDSLTSCLRSHGSYSSGLDALHYSNPGRGCSNGSGSLGKPCGSQHVEFPKVPMNFSEWQAAIDAPSTHSVDHQGKNDSFVGHPFWDTACTSSSLLNGLSRISSTGYSCSGELLPQVFTKPSPLCPLKDEGEDDEHEPSSPMSNRLFQSQESIPPSSLILDTVPDDAYEKNSRSLEVPS